MNLTRLKSGIWQVELRVPVDVRHVLGKTRFAKSTKTQDKRTAMRLAAPVLADWQQAIEQARRDPSQLISHVLNRDVDVLSAKRLNPRQDTMRWLSALRPSQAERYRLLDFSKGVPLPAFMDQFAHEHYANRRTQTEARRYILEATRFLPTFSDLTKSCAQQWVSSEESKPASHRRSAKTLQKGVGFLSELCAVKA